MERPLLAPHSEPCLCGGRPGECSEHWMWSERHFESGVASFWLRELSLHLPEPQFPGQKVTLKDHIKQYRPCERALQAQCFIETFASA